MNGCEVRIFPFRCRRWRCQRCGTKKLRETRERLKEGLIGRTLLITFTSPGEDPAISWEELAGRWKRLHTSMERECGPFEYARVTEIQDRGSPHFHVIVRDIRPRLAWLSNAAEKAGFGRVVDVSRTHTRTVSYLTKEIGPGTKGDGLPPHARRVVFSAGWAPRPKRWSSPLEGRWMMAAATTRRTAQSAMARGYRIVQLVFGPLDRWRWPRYAPVEWFSLDVFFGRCGRRAA